MYTAANNDIGLHMGCTSVAAPASAFGQAVGSRPGVPRLSRRRCDIDGSTASVRQQIHITTDTAITWDTNQWVVNKLLPEAQNCGIGQRLKPFAYVATEKRILRRVLLENEIIPDATGITNLDALPPTFTHFIKETMA